jgi:DNA-directed RNA polymerase specialized sigma24 family protein
MPPRDAARDLETLKVLLLTPALRTLHMCNRYVADGWSARRIAEEMHTTEAAVRKAVGRALKKLAALNGTKLSRFDVSLIKKR